MNLDDNISNAFEVVRKTYENVAKLLVSVDKLTLDKGYEPCREKFLRYSSDAYVDGWLFNDIVKIYQFRKDSFMYENDWRDGPIYVIDICFYGSPKIKVAQFVYEDINNWSKGISLSSSWAFTNPINKDFYNSDFDHIEKDGYIFIEPRTEEISNKYWGLKHCRLNEFNLSEIVDDNGVGKLIDIFDSFREMKD